MMQMTKRSYGLIRESTLFDRCLCVFFFDGALFVNYKFLAVVRVSHDNIKIFFVFFEIMISLDQLDINREASYEKMPLNTISTHQ